jgi:hypothetical protein
MNVPGELTQAAHDRQFRYRHQAYLDHIDRRTLANRVGLRLIQLGNALSSTQPIRTQS